MTGRRRVTTCGTTSRTTGCISAGCTVAIAALTPALDVGPVMSEFTWMPGDRVRIHGERKEYVVVRINLNDTVDLKAPNGNTRTVYSTRITPPAKRRT